MTQVHVPQRAAWEARKIGRNLPRPNLECKDCLGPVRSGNSSGVFFHNEPKGFPGLQTIARNVGPKGEK